MRKTIDIEPYELEESDTICGYNLKNLTLFAMAARKAGVTDEELRSFCINAENAFNFVRNEQEEAFNKAFNNICETFNRKSGTITDLDKEDL